jgi:hypothetical protein
VLARNEASLLELLARADVPEALADAALHRAVRTAADGGAVVIAAGHSVPAAWRAAVQRAAVLNGATVLPE